MNDKLSYEWAEFVRFMLRFYGKKNLYGYEDFIQKISKECANYDNMQTAVHHCSDKIHEFMMGR